jgi:Flp pilus assembly protein TadD
VFEPDNADFKLGLVKCAIALRNFDHALALLDELIQASPDQEGLWSLQANILIQQERSAQAIVSLEVLRRLGKASAANLYTLGDLYLGQESRDLALQAYLQAAETDAGQYPARALRPAQILLSRGAHDEAKTLLAKIREGTGTLAEEDALKLLKLEARVATARGEGDAAIRTLETIIARNPLDAEALLLAGDHYARSGDPQTAELRFEAAAKIEGSEADAFLKLAQLNVQARRYAPAVELLRKAQKVRPRDNVQRYLERVEQLALRAR